MVIDLSPVAIATVINRAVGTSNTISTTATASTTPLLGYYSSSFVPGAIYIMAGTMPANISTVTSYSAISANILVTFNAYGLSLGATLSGNASSINSPHVAASASGTATWFLGATRTMSSTVIGDTFIQAFMGTIGITGSGADMTVPSTAVTSGALYAMGALTLTFPVSV